MTDVRETIRNSFEELGVLYDEGILNKCVELCVDHGVDDADELVDSWMAFSVSTLRGENPTPQHLARFEKDILARKAKKREKYANCTDLLRDITGDSITAYSQTPKRFAQTPDVPRHRLAVSPRGNFSPASFSPIPGTPSSKYSGRTNSGRVICGEPQLECEDELKGEVSVKCTDNNLTLDHNFMAYTLVDCAQAAQSHLNRVFSKITDRFKLDDPVPISSKHPVSILVAGRVVCDADGKLNAESLLLEGSHSSGGDVVRLDLSAIPSYSVFPGQVLAVEGLNVTGRHMIAQKLWCDGSPSSPPSTILLSGSLKIMIACGPFTTTDCLTYQALADFLEIVVREEPHLLLLTGPLVDHNHPVISSLVMAETFEDMFYRLLQQIMDSLKNLKTHVVLVSSHRESHGAAVFPTFPVPAQQHDKLLVVADPSVLDVEGVTIAVTSNDILMDLGKEEVSFPPLSGDRLARLAGHVLQQQSFYPLRPPSAVPLDPTLERHLQLSSKPHILVLPSDLRCFIKEIDGCTVVNPERLTKGVMGGAFAKLVISSNGKISGQVIKI